MDKKPLIGKKWLVIGIILLFIGITISPGSSTNKDNSITRTDSEITSNDFEFIGIDGITQYYIGPAFFGFEWVINMKIKNNGDTKSHISAIGAMYRISRPFKRAGFFGYITGYYNPWNNGEIKVLDTIHYSPFQSLLPGIYHIIVDIGTSWNSMTPVVDGIFFIFRNHIYPMN